MVPVAVPGSRPRLRQGRDGPRTVEHRPPPDHPGAQFLLQYILGKLVDPDTKFFDLRVMEEQID